MPRYAQQPDAIDTSRPILQPLSPERQAEIDALSWIGYLTNTPEWKAIRSFMLTIFPASMVSGASEGLEVHHSKWCKRGYERPRDLAVTTADEHRAIHNTLEPLTMLERLIEAEQDSRWFSLLTEYRKHLAAKELEELPPFRELVEEAAEVCT